MNVLPWDDLVAAKAHVTSDPVVLLGVVDCRHVKRVVAERAYDLQGCNRSIVELLRGLGLQDGIGNCLHPRLRVVRVGISVTVEPVLLGIHSKALRNEIDFDTVDVLYQSGDWWEQLLRDVPIRVDLQVLPLVHVLFGTVGHVTNGGFLSLCSWS